MKKTDELRKKINKIGDLLERMPNNEKKRMLINEYYDLLAFFNEGTYERNFENRKAVKQENNKVISILNNQIKLYPIVNEIYGYYKANKYDHKKILIDNNCNFDELQTLVKTFFKSLPINIDKLYNEMCFEGKIRISSNNNFGGCTYAAPNLNLSQIIIDSSNEFKNLYFYIALVHEMGHAYHFEFIKDFPNYSGINVGAEFFSQLIEKLFINYLKENYHDKIAADYSDLEYHLKIFNEAAIFKILNEKIFPSDDCIIEDIEIKTSLYDENDIKKMCGSVLMSELSLYSEIYLIDDLVSNYFLEKINQNKIDGFKETLNFLRSNYTLDEIIDKYLSDMSYTKTRIYELSERINNIKSKRKSLNK